HALGELHTMKGEARMLGLAEIARDAHALEEALAGVSEAGDTAALERIDSLASAISAKHGEPETPTRAVSPELGYVRLAHVETVCDTLDELRAFVKDEDVRARLDKAIEAAFALRLASIGPMLEELAIHARALAREQGKDVLVRVEGGSVEIERALLDALKDALVHIVRNAIDHGIEVPSERADKAKLARLTISATPRSSDIEVAVIDDGRGISLDAVRAAARVAGVQA